MVLIAPSYQTDVVLLASAVGRDKAAVLGKQAFVSRNNRVWANAR